MINLIKITTTKIVTQLKHLPFPELCKPKKVKLCNQCNKDTKQRTTRIPSGIWSCLLTAMRERRVSSQHMVKSLTMNRYMSLFNLKLWTQIWSININFRPSPLHWTFCVLVRLGLNFHPSYWWNAGGGEGSVGPAAFFFVTDGHKRDYFSHASQRARGTTKKWTRPIQCFMLSRLTKSVLVQEW